MMPNAAHRDNARTTFAFTGKEDMRPVFDTVLAEFDKGIVNQIRTIFPNTSSLPFWLMATIAGWVSLRSVLIT